MPKEYNGHRSWNAWNVSLWIGNDEGTYREAVRCLQATKTIGAACRKFSREVIPYGDKTPDGAVYNRLCVKLALEGLGIEQRKEDNGNA